MMASLLSKVCSMPDDFLVSGNKSMVQLLKESGYLDRQEIIAKNEIVEFLRTHPDLFDSWEKYSLDRRCSTGWHLLHKDDEWIVGHLNIDGKENEQTFLSSFDACAVFILKELEQIAANAS
jgi:hypothetical protein